MGNQAMSSADWDDVLGDQLRVAVSLPLGASEAAPTDPRLAAQLLNSLAVVDAGRLFTGSDDYPPEDCSRLELKIDLLMHLMAVMLQDRLPPNQAVILSERGLVGALGAFPARTRRIALYPSRQLPLPLVFEMQETICREPSCGARWAHLEPDLRDALGRWIFRIHRREVARRRAD